MQRVVLLPRFSHTLLFESSTSLTFRGNLGLLETLTRNFHVAQTFYTSPSVLTVRSGGAVTYTEAKPYSSASIADSTKVDKKQKLVVLGTGWGAINFLKDFKNASFDVQVISTQNYFALNPLLPCVACGTLQARSLGEPVRNVIKKKDYMHFCEAECVKIDAENHKVHCHSSLDNGKEEFAVDYDYLVIAVGSCSNTFNIPGVSENCLFLKDLEDAEKIRRSIINCFERASLPNLREEERKRILHFVIVGGGPTGVELAGQLHDFINKNLSKLYPDVKDLAKVTLLEAADHILNMFNKKVRTSGAAKFQRDGIDLRTGAKVVKVSEKEIFIEGPKSGEAIPLPYGMAVWSTGIATRPVIKDFIKQIGQGDRNAVATDEWLRVKGFESVYAFGDCAAINQRKVLDDVSAIFQTADKDSSGTLTDKEFQEIFGDLCKRYQQVELYFKSKKIRNLLDLVKGSNGGAVKKSNELDIEEFKIALSEVDSYIKKLPSTGQVSSQQGIYLANCFNHMVEREKNPEGPVRFGEGGRYPFQPFRYNHQGLLVSLGGEKAGVKFPSGQELVGHLSQSVWYLVYTTKLVSWRSRVHVVSEWTRRFLFGRDPNCI